MCDPDDDGDSVNDDVDNCPVDSNGDQANHDEDSLGDACDGDDDGDGELDDVDNCPVDSNADQADLDSDDAGDVCDPDDDGDTVNDDSDNCPLDSNGDQANHDSDSNGDACDADDDDDTVNDDVDQCSVLSGSAPAGCPISAREMKLTWSPKSNRFKGRMSTTGQVTCVNVRQVTIYRIQAGPDAVAGEPTTDADGRFSLKPRKVKDGRYYALSSEITLPDVATCSETKSKAVKV